MAHNLSSSRKTKWRSWLQSCGALDAKRPNSLTFVLDSNIWISALLFGGLPEKAVFFADANVRLISSRYITDEVVKIIKQQRPKIPHKFITAVRLGLGNYEVPVPEMAISGIRDVKDEPVVRLAESYGAVIITGDRDILEYDGDVTSITLNEFAELFDID